MRIFLRSIAALLLLFPLLAFAISSARPSDVLCNSTHLIVGTILKATPKNCRIDTRLEGKVILDCGSTGLIGLVVEVSEILGQKNETIDYPSEVGVAIGKTIGLESAGIVFPPVEIYDRVGVLSVSRKPVTNELISKIYEGQQFIFSISIRRGDVWRNGQILRNYLDTPPYYTKVWHLAKRAWIMELLKSSDGKSCPKPVLR